MARPQRECACQPGHLRWRRKLMRKLSHPESWQQTQPWNCTTAASARARAGRTRAVVPKMDVQQREFMGEHGYLILQQVLSPAQLAELNGMFDSELAKGPPDEELLASARSNVYSLKADGSPTRPGEMHQQSATIGTQTKALADTSRTFHMPRSARGRTFHNASHRALIAHHRVMPILEELCQDLHWGHTAPAVPPAQRHCVRLDFDQMHYKPPSQTVATDGGGGMHGNPNRLHITCVYELSSVGPGDGGFACLPGSHHHKFRMPTHEGWRHQWADGSADHATLCVRSPSPGQPYVIVPLAVEPTPPVHAGMRWPVDVPVHRVELQAGDVLLFTERLTHSTVPWRGNGDRRTVFFKYVQRHMKWSSMGQLYDELDPDLTREQRDVLSCPDRFLNDEMERGQGQPPTIGPESPWTWKEGRVTTGPRL